MMKRILINLTFLLFYTIPCFAQDPSFNYVDIETIVSDLEKNQKSSDYYSKSYISTLICFDERIRETITTIDPSNPWLTHDCLNESEVPDMYTMNYKIKLNTIQELFEDSENIEKIKMNFSNISRGDSIELSNQIYLNGSEQAIFQFVHGQLWSVYKAKLDTDSVVITNLALGVIR